MNASITLFLRVDQIKTNGAATIYLRFTHNRKKLDLSLKKELLPNTPINITKLKELKPQDRLPYYNWNKQKETITKGEPNYQKLNFILAREKKRALDIILNTQLYNKPLTRNHFKKEFLQEQTTTNAHDYFLQELEKRKTQYSKETIRSYKSILSKLKEYKPNLELKDITHTFLTTYEHYMLLPKEENGKGNDKRTVANNMKIIKTFVNIAVKNGDLFKESNPFNEYQIKKNKGTSNRSFLEPKEIEKLHTLYQNYQPLTKPMKTLSPEEWAARKQNQQPTPAEYNVLRYFLFACYTGLRFQDIRELSYEHIKTRLVQQQDSNQFEEKHYIDIDMHKTGFTVKIPLLQKAQELIQYSTKNKNQKEKKEKDQKIFSTISNQKTNKHLKDIMKMAGIDKKITFHCSRHTFASISILYGLPQKFVQNILGHQNTATTEIYSHIVDDYLFQHIDTLNQKLEEKPSIRKQAKPQKKTDSLLEKLIHIDPNKLEKLIHLAEAIG